MAAPPLGAGRRRHEPHRHPVAEAEAGGHGHVRRRAGGVADQQLDVGRRLAGQVAEQAVEGTGAGGGVGAVGDRGRLAAVEADHDREQPGVRHLAGLRRGGLSAAAAAAGSRVKRRTNW